MIEASRNLFRFGLMILAVSLSVSSAHAAQSGLVEVDQTPLYEGPGKKFRKIFDVPKGTQVQASNLPIDGFFKVRLASGKIGFISSDALALSEKKVETSGVTYPTTPEATGPRTVSKSQVAPPVKSGGNIHFSVLGGYHFFSAAEISQTYSVSQLSSGLAYGGELTFFPTPSLGAMIRFERLSRSVNVNTKPDLTGEPYTFSLSSIPVMLGLEIPIAMEKNSGLSFAVLLGIGASTQFAGTDTNFTSNNVTTYNGTALAALFKFDYAIALSEGFAFFGEAGYRYLKTGSISPGLAANGSNIFRDVSGNPFPLHLDMSGLIFSAGMRFSF